MICITVDVSSCRLSTRGGGRARARVGTGSVYPMRAARMVM
jgi:hypothetical protein